LQRVLTGVAGSLLGLQGERTRLAGVGSAGDDRSGADLLREDAEAAESEAALCRDREQILQVSEELPLSTAGCHPTAGVQMHHTVSDTNRQW
jgi:hypothetical protein